MDSEKTKLLDIDVANSKGRSKCLKIVCVSIFPCVPARFILGVMLFFGGIVFFVVRANISVAIVAMVNATADQRVIVNSTSSCHPTAPLFNWNNEQQGFILSGFFYGYILLQIPGGYLATRFSAKYVIFCGIFIPAILAIITPLATSLTTSIVPILVIRILQGTIGSVCYPAMHALIGRWAAPNERSRMSTISDCGEIVGNIVTFPIVGILCNCGFAGGWPSVFYVSGIVCILWCILWLFLVYDTPATHPRISQNELEYIQTALQTEEKEKVGRAPWFKILTSSAVWANMIAHVCNDFGFYALLTSLPMYLKDTQEVDIKSNGLLSAIPFAAFAVTSILGSLVTDFALTRGFPVVVARKFNTFCAMVGAAFFIVMAGYFGNTPPKAVALVSAALGINGLLTSGTGPNVLDIAPRYAGVVMGIVNMFSSTAGIVAPLVAKSIATAPLEEVDVLREQWREFFIVAAEVYVFGAIIFMVLASGKVQSWAKSAKELARLPETDRTAVNSRPSPPLPTLNIQETT